MRKIAPSRRYYLAGVKAILRTRLARRINLFPEATLDLGQIATPVRRQQGVLHVTMKTAVRPVADPRDVSVLHLIEVDAIDVSKLARPVSEHDREKEYPAFDFWAPISRHRRIIA
jgi:hypothetical protein